MAFVTVAAEAEIEEVIKGSRFIAEVRSIASVEQAAEHLEAARAGHPDAAHHCWAYRLGEAMRFSDDGEPGGTAGRPMLEVLLKRELDAVSAVVIRYFGGTKLGAGGLVRAYGGSLAMALDRAGRLEVEDRRELVLRAPFAELDAVYRLLDATRGSQRLSEGFEAAGLVARVELPESEVEGFRLRLSDVTRGAAALHDAPSAASPSSEE